MLSGRLCGAGWSVTSTSRPRSWSGARATSWAPWWRSVCPGRARRTSGSSSHQTVSGWSPYFSSPSGMIYSGSGVQQLRGSEVAHHALYARRWPIPPPSPQATGANITNIVFIKIIVTYCNKINYELITGGGMHSQPFCNEDGFKAFHTRVPVLYPVLF